MQHILPTARSLRTLYLLSSDKLWFALAIVSCLLIAGELMGVMQATVPPPFDRGFGL